VDEVSQKLNIYHIAVKAVCWPNYWLASGKL